MGPFNILICRNLLIYYIVFLRQRRDVSSGGADFITAILLRALLLLHPGWIGLSLCVVGRCTSGGNAVKDGKSFVLITAGD